MNRPLCWVCSVVGAAIALAAFAAYYGASKPVYAEVPGSKLPALVVPVSS